MRFTASQIAELTGGRLVGPDVEVDGAAFDSREVRGGEVFVAIRGERDGHDFIAAALEAGAVACLTAEEPVGATAIVVEDPAAALTILGNAARKRLPDTAVGVTGSVGKTTTKDLTAAAIGGSRRTHANLRSFNNELGLPVTLMNAPDDTEVTVLEMGSRGRGHIAELCAIGEPTIGIVTTVDLVHTELFGGLDDVALAKGELMEALPASGVAILNAENPHVMAMTQRTQASVLSFGLETGDVRACHVAVDSLLRPSFVLWTPWGETRVELGVRGVHNVANALAASAAALVCDVELSAVAAGLATEDLSPLRMDLKRAPSGALILNDSYNAGPASVEAALRALAQLNAKTRTAVLGPMAELGEHGPEAHRKIASIAEDLGIRLISVGANDYGVENVTDLDAAAVILGDVGEGDAVLVKGSRVAGMERLARMLLA